MQTISVLFVTVHWSIKIMYLSEKQKLLLVDHSHSVLLLKKHEGYFLSLKSVAV